MFNNSFIVRLLLAPLLLFGAEVTTYSQNTRPAELIGLATSYHHGFGNVQIVVFLTDSAHGHSSWFGGFRDFSKAGKIVLNCLHCTQFCAILQEKSFRNSRSHRDHLRSHGNGNFRRFFLSRNIGYIFTINFYFSPPKLYINNKISL